MRQRVSEGDIVAHVGAASIQDHQDGGCDQSGHWIVPKLAVHHGLQVQHIVHRTLHKQQT